jgi:hypothetical protein
MCVCVYLTDRLTGWLTKSITLWTEYFLKPYSSPASEITYTLRYPKIRYIFLSWTKWNKSTALHPTSLTCILISLFHRRLSLSSVFFPQDYPQNRLCKSLFRFHHACHIHCLSHPLMCYHPSNVTLLSYNETPAAAQLPLSLCESPVCSSRTYLCRCVSPPSAAVGPTAVAVCDARRGA